MTAGGFLTCEPIVKAFGVHEIKNKAQAIRRVWPEALPKGKEEIGVYEAAYFIYVFGSTFSIKDVYDRKAADRIWSAAYSYNSATSKNIVTMLGDLIAEPSQDITEVEISKTTGIMKVIRRDGSVIDFVPDSTGLTTSPQVEDVTIIKLDFFKDLNNLFKYNKA